MSGWDEKRKERAYAESLDTMWRFLQMGGMKSNYPLLKEYCMDLRRLMTQKTAGQEKYAAKGDISFDDIFTICNAIVIEAMALVFSGDLEAQK